MMQEGDGGGECGEREKQSRRLCPSLFKEDNEEREAEPTRWGKSQHTCCPRSIIQDERTRPRHTFIRLVRTVLPCPLVTLQLSIQSSTITLTMSRGQPQNVPEDVQRLRQEGRHSTYGIIDRKIVGRYRKTSLMNVCISLHFLSD